MDIRLLKAGESGLGYIYILKDPNTDEIRYVGKTNNIKNRLKDHIRKSKLSKTHKNNWIQSLLIKNQEPVIEIIEEITNKNWGIREQYWIDFYRGEGVRLTNIANGGVGGNLGDLVNEKISKANKGRVFSNETKEKIKLKHIGKKHSIETINLFKEQRSGEKNSMYGKKVKESSKKYKKIAQLDLNNNLIKIWDGLIIASKELKINRCSITDVCYGRHKTAGGYKWKLI